MARFLLITLLSVLLNCTPTSISKSYVLSNGSEALIPPRAIFFDGDVTDESMVALAAAIDTEYDRGQRNIMLVVNSPGGGVSAGLDFIIAVDKFKKQTKTTFTCVVDGMAASMAAVIFEGICDTRLMTKRSLLLFHGARIGNNNGGTQETWEETAEMIRVINEMMASIAAPKLGMTDEAFLERIHGRDWTLSWKDALKAKAIDGTIDTGELPVVQ